MYLRLINSRKKTRDKKIKNVHAALNSNTVCVNSRVPYHIVSTCSMVTNSITDQMGIFSCIELAFSIGNA